MFRKFVSVKLLCETESVDLKMYFLNNFLGIFLNDTLNGWFMFKNLLISVIFFQNCQSDNIL